ncbi:MAG: hypothetical protein P8015_18995 [Acidihalobacter sp.]
MSEAAEYRPPLADYFDDLEKRYGVWRVMPSTTIHASPRWKRRTSRHC